MSMRILCRRSVIAPIAIRAQSLRADPPPLSDAQWSHLWLLIQQGEVDVAQAWTAPAARAVLLAILYHALTDTAWSSLPSWAPNESLVATTHLRWRSTGLLRR